MAFRLLLVPLLALLLVGTNGGHAAADNRPSPSDDSFLQALPPAILERAGVSAQVRWDLSLGEAGFVVSVSLEAVGDVEEPVLFQQVVGVAAAIVAVTDGAGPSGLRLLVGERLDLLIWMDDYREFASGVATEQEFRTRWKVLSSEQGWARAWSWPAKEEEGESALAETTPAPSGPGLEAPAMGGPRQASATPIPLENWPQIEKPVRATTPSAQERTAPTVTPPMATAEATPLPEGTSQAAEENREGGGHPDRWPASVAKYAEEIRQAARTYGVDADLLAAIMTQESMGEPKAVGRWVWIGITGRFERAFGLMQVMPFEVEARQVPITEAWDPQTNIVLGASVLADKLANTQIADYWHRVMGYYGYGDRLSDYWLERVKGFWQEYTR